MRKKKLKAKKLHQRLTFWLGIVVLGSLIGLAVQFTRAWVEPAAPAPDGNIAAPINTGSVEQTKNGTVAQPADICVDPDGPLGPKPKVCLGTGGTSGGGVPDGSIVMWSGAADSIPAGWVLCDGRHGSPDLRGRFILGSGGGSGAGGYGLGTFTTYVYGNNIAVYTAGISFPYYSLAFIIKNSSFVGDTIITGGDHYASECTSAGGTVQVDGSNQFCKFSGTNASCPSGWAQYKKWSETSGKTCGGVAGGSPSCPPDPTMSKPTGQHGWSDASVLAESFLYSDGARVTSPIDQNLYLYNLSSYQSDLASIHNEYTQNYCVPYYGSGYYMACPGGNEQGPYYDYDSGQYFTQCYDSNWWQATYVCRKDNNYCGNTNQRTCSATVTAVGCY